MKNQNLSDADLAAYSGEHLRYEFHYFWFAAKEASKFDKPEPMASVFIESFVIHLRNLIDFFCIQAGKEQPDDVIASDFCPGWNEPLSSTLKDARERANKELSHLTLQRKPGLDPSKQWDLDGLYKEVISIARRFVSQASTAKLSPEIGKWLPQADLRPTVVAVGPAIMATNTTTTMTTYVYTALVTPPQIDP
jgi:hypothetical protein